LANVLFFIEKLGVSSMPKNRTHGKISKLLLGKSFPEVDKALDFSSRVLGRSQRRVLHTLPEAILVGLIVSGQAKGCVSGAVHVIVDMVDSVAKKQISNKIENGGEINGRKKTEKKGNKKEK
jgi:hypothetical protein